MIDKWTRRTPDTHTFHRSTAPTPSPFITPPPPPSYLFMGAGVGGQHSSLHDLPLGADTRQEVSAMTLEVRL